jgi:hypothetical protein
MTVTSKQFTLVSPKAPRLPSATAVYDEKALNEFNNSLRLYFNQLDNFDQSLIASSGGKFLSAPYGAFQDTTSQVAAINTATALKFGVLDFANEVFIENGTKIRVANAGIYNIQFSVQAQNADNVAHDMSIWLRQGSDGGASFDIPGSTGLVGLPARKTATDFFHSIFGWNYFVSLQVDDYIEIYWSTESTLATIEYYPISGAPIRPATASAVVSMSFVSALPVG